MRKTKETSEEELGTREMNHPVNKTQDEENVEEDRTSSAASIVTSIRNIWNKLKKGVKMTTNMNTKILEIDSTQQC